MREKRRERRLTYFKITAREKANKRKQSRNKTKQKSLTKLNIVFHQHAYQNNRNLPSKTALKEGERSPEEF